MPSTTHLQSLWHLLTDHVPAIVWAVDRDMRFISSQGSGLAALDLEPDQVVGTHLYEFLGTDDPEIPSVRSHLDALSGKPASYESAFNGRHFLTFTYPMREESGRITGAVGIAIDVTASYSAQLESDHFFDLSLDLMCVAGTDGYFKHLNPRFEEVLGYSADEMKAAPFTDFLHPDDVTASEQQLGSLAEGQKVMDFVNRYRTKEGEYRWFEWRAVPFEEAGLVFGVARDITQRREMERRLGLVSIALDRSPDAAYLLTEDARIRYANEAAVAMLGYSHEEFLERTVPELNNTPEAIRLRWPNIWAKVKSGSRLMLQSLHRAKDGRVIPVEIAASFVTFGAEEYISAFARDVTDQRRTARALHKRESRMRALFDIAAQPSADIDAQLQAALARATEALELDLGIISRIEDDYYTVEHSYAPTVDLPPGTTLPLGDTYCSLTYRAEEIVALDEVGSSSHRSHPCYTATGLEAYLGIVLFVGGRRYGTLNVSGSSPRTEPFDEADREFLALLAIWVGSTLERREAEAKLRASEEALALAVRGANLGLWDWEVPSGVTRYSRRWAEMLGYTLEELEPSVRTWERLVHPDDLPKARAALEAHFAGTVPIYEIEHRLRTKNGSWRWVLTQGKLLERGEDGEPIRIAGTHLDIDARKRSEQARVAEFERGQRFQEAIMRMNTHPAVVEGNFQVAAAAVTEIVAVALDVERVGIWLLEPSGAALEPVDQYQRAAGAHSRRGRVAVAEYPRYFEAIRSGTVLDVQDALHDPRTQEFAETYFSRFHIASLLDATIRVRGEVVGVVTHEHVGETRTWRADEVAFAIQVADQVAQAILNQERREDELTQRQLEGQIQQAQKLESLGILAGGIAHDFNNLLTAILGNANLARIEVAEGSAIHANLEDIEAASRRAADLCKQMLAYSGKGSFVIEVVDLRTVVREMTNMLDVSISKKVQLNLQFTDDVPPVRADVTQVRQIIMNLITNASEAIGDDSGAIIIRLGAMEVSSDGRDHTFVTDIPAGRYTYLEVSDTGSGMPEHVRDRLFDPFFTTKFTGRGLGMAAVLGIVRGHRGSIEVESEPGKGSTFRVFFPATTGPVTSEARAVESPEQRWLGSGLVLLVDDEAAVRSLGRKMLNRLGFDVLTAADGEEAVEVFRQHQDDIQCVLLDLTMPKMDGAACFEALRGLRSDVRVVLSSGYHGQEVASRFAGRGLAGFVQKPYQLAHLRQILHDVLGENSLGSSPDGGGGA